MRETVIYHESFYEDGAVFEKIPSWQQQFLSSNEATDLLEVFKFDRSKAESFIQLLTQGEGLSLDATQDNRAQLFRYYFNNANQLKSEGKTNLSVGYPFYFERTQRALLNIPILFFPVEIIAEISENESFRIQSAAPIYILNYHLFEYLSARYQIDCTLIYNMAAAKAPVSEIIDEIGITLQKHLKINFNNAPNKIFPLPTLDSLNGETEQINVFYNAVMGNFTLPYQGFHRFEDKLVTPTAKESPISFLQGFLPTDVSQRNALLKASASGLQVITANAGTGKTTTAINLVTQAMSQGKRTLVVSNRLKTLLKIQGELAKWQLEKYAFIIKDMESDLPILLNICRSIGQNLELRDKKNFNSKAFELATSQLKQQYNKLHQAYVTLQKDMGVANDWHTLVGKWLAANSIESREVLNVQLDAKTFDFNKEEYKSLRLDVQSAAVLFTKINTLDHELSNLHPTIFVEKEKEESAAYLQEKINHFIQRLDTLHREHLFVLERFRQQQRAMYQVRYDNLTALVDKIASQTEAGNKLYGSDFQTTGVWSNIIGVFSPKQREISKLQTELKANYNALIKIHLAENSFRFDFPSLTPSKPAKMAKIVKDFSNRLISWNNNVDMQVEKEVTLLDAISPNADDSIKTLDTAFDTLVEHLNEARIYSEPIERKITTITENRKLAQHLREKLERTLKHFDDFDQFYDWQHFWLNCEPKSHKVIEGLIRSKALNWVAALDSWYFHWVLQNNYQSTMPQQKDTSTMIDTHSKEVQMLLPAQIDFVSHYRRLDGIRLNRKKRLFEKDNLKLYDTLVELFDNEHTTLLDFFPVLLATPSVASSVLQAANFDLIIFDDAQAYSAESCNNLFAKATQIVVLGDDFNIHNKPESLLYQSLVSKSLHAQNHLSIIHTTQSDEMNAFLDALFPSESMRLPKIHATDFFHRIEVYGRYEEEKGINTQEAEQVVVQLNQIQKLANSRYPSVGIITSTYEQRDLISNLLLKIKQKRLVGYDKIQQLERNNFGVYHWSEAVGLHFDIVFVSFTYGIKDSKGKLSNEIQFLNDDNGLESLYVMLTRANQALYWFNSIPSDYLDEFANAPFAKGTYVLSKLFQYFETNTSTKDYKATNEILHDIANATGTTRQTQSNALLEEISEQLKITLGEDRIVYAPTIGSLTVPLMILPQAEDKPTIILRLDGTFTLPYTPDPMWENQFVATLESQNYIIIESWSVNWWRNPTTETQRLVNAIHQLDNANSTTLPPIEDNTPQEITQPMAEEDNSDVIMDNTSSDNMPLADSDAQQVTDNTYNNEAGS